MTRRWRRKASCGRGEAGGYALVLTLLLLAMMTIIATRFADRGATARNDAVFWVNAAEAAPRLASGMAEAVFALSTRPASAIGFGAASAEPGQLIIPDDRPYRSETGAIMQVLDSRGSLSLNIVDRRMLTQFLIESGVEPRRADRMLDVLEDYTDTDDLKRLNGAESREYREAGLPSPRNDYLLSIDELTRLPGWRDDPVWLEKVLPVLSTRRSAVLNPNLLSRELLMVLPGATPERVALFLERRKIAPFHSGAAATAQTGWPFNDDSMIFYPSNQVSIKISHPDSPYGKKATLLFTPGGEAPWVISDTSVAAFPGPQESASAPGGVLPFSVNYTDPSVAPAL